MRWGSIIVSFVVYGVRSYVGRVETAVTITSIGAAGYIPVELEGLLERFSLDAQSWAQHVARYGSLFHRVAGVVEQLLDYARRRQQRWFRGQGGSQQLYVVDRTTA